MLQDLTDCGHLRAFTLGDPASSVLQVYAIIDPVSEKGQKWSSLLEVSPGRPWLRGVASSDVYHAKVIETLDHVGLTVLLNPPMDMTEVRYLQKGVSAKGS
jgi:hypothetical protein